MQDINVLKIAAATLDISPAYPLRLAGFADRTTVFRETIEPIQAQLLLLEQQGTRVLLVGADLLWWGRELTARLSRKLAGVLDIDPVYVVLTATHNHSGPATGSEFLPSLETPDEGYLAWIEEAIVRAAGPLHSRLQPAFLTIWHDDVHMNVNRRLRIGEEIVMAPNFDEAIDHRATVLRFCDAAGAPLVHLVHYPCHANVSAENSLHGDYPGVLRRRLEEVYPSSVTIFLQGATGDVRPTIVIGNKFARMGYQEAQLFGNHFANQILHLIDGAGRELTASLSLKQDTVLLPLDAQYQEPELRRLLEEGDLEGERAAWAAKVLAWPTYDTRSLNMKRLGLSPEFSILSLNAEVVQEYAVYARRLDPGLVTIGYTDGMIGYLCTDEQIRQGGYEPVESGFWFALPGPYKPEIEEIIKETMAVLCQN